MESIKSFDGEFRFLSNFYPSSFTQDRITWKTVEHFFQAQKTTTQNDFMDIINAETPRQAKHSGNKIVVRLDWEFIKTSIMLDGVRLKFNQNPDIAEKLIATGAIHLLEGNIWHDNFWGNCTCIQAKCLLKGQNMLGKILMLVREELRR